MQRHLTLLGLLCCWGQSPLIVQAAGCVFNVTRDCGQLCYTGISGSITLPTNCNGTYCNNMNCNYQVCPPSSTGSISITFPYMDVESCTFDYVVLNGTRICLPFNDTRQYYRDINGCLSVPFRSDHSVMRSGFTMLYSAQAVCPVHYTANAANVSLPAECGGLYCPNMDCSIHICPDSRADYVTLTFSLFHVDDNETCSGDVLEVAGTAYCSLDSVPRVFPLDQRGCLNLTFRSDSSSQGLGFRFTYQAGVEVTSCPAVFMGPKSVVYFPTPPPDVNLNCTMQVCLGPQAQNVTLTARQWDLSCPDDFLETGGRRYCQASPQGEVLPLDGRGCLDLLLHRNNSRGGVQLLYSLYKPECGVGDLVADSGLLSVPTPCQGRYCDNLDCSYRVCPSSASRSLAFSLLMIDVVDSSCTGDYLTIGPSQQRYCSLVNVPPVDVDDWGCVSVGFHSDGHGGGHGFMLSFSAYSYDCGVQSYYADNGTITLPAYCNGKYCPNLNCKYTLCPESRSTHVQITQRIFHTVNTNCSGDYLTIDETRVCEFDPQPKLYPVDDRGCLSLTFRSDNVSSDFGFWLDYTAMSPSSYVTTETPEQTPSTLASISREVIVVASVLSAVLAVVLIALVVVSVLLWRARRRRLSAPPCLPHIEVISMSETAKARSNDYVDPVAPSDVRVEESNYESMEELYQNA